MVYLFSVRGVTPNDGYPRVCFNRKELTSPSEVPQATLAASRGTRGAKVSNALGRKAFLS